MIALTGATGYIGSALLRVLEDGGQPLVTVGRQTQQGVAHRSLDLSAKAGFREALAGVHTLVHCAGIAHHKGSAQVLEQVNVLATLALADAALDAGCRKFVFLSSLNLVPAEQPAAEVPVSQLPPPKDAYGASKWRAEQRLEAMLQGSQCQLLIVRPALVYDDPPVASLAQLSALVNRWPLSMPPLGSRSMVARPDLVALLAELAVAPVQGRAVQRIAVTDGECYNLRQIAQALRVGSPPWVPVPASLLWLMSGLRDRINGLPSGSTWRGLSGRKWCGQGPRPAGFQPTVTLDGER